MATLQLAGTFVTMSHSDDVMDPGTVAAVTLAGQPCKRMSEPELVSHATVG